MCQLYIKLKLKMQNYGNILLSFVWRFVQQSKIFHSWTHRNHLNINYILQRMEFEFLNGIEATVLWLQQSLRSISKIKSVCFCYYVAQVLYENLLNVWHVLEN